MIFINIFRYRDKKSPDILGKYPQEFHISSLPERRYLWTSRILAIFAVVSFCLNVMLTLLLYILLPQKNSAPDFYVVNQNLFTLEKALPLNINTNFIDLLTEKYIADYFIKHRKVKEYMDRQIELCRERGYSKTILGRKRPIHEINASSFMIRQLGERLAMNSPIQGSAADIIKLAMVRVYKRLKRDFPDSKLILQVHDELILSVPLKDREAVKEVLRESMEEAISLSVRLVADVNEGYSWYDLK